MNFLNIFFGIITIVCLIFAVYTYFKSREYIYPLIEKLRASWNSFREIRNFASKIKAIIESEQMSETEKLNSIQQLSELLNQNMGPKMNTIDENKDWGVLSVKEILEHVKK